MRDDLKQIQWPITDSTFKVVGGVSISPVKAIASHSTFSITDSTFDFQSLKQKLILIRNANMIPHNVY